MFCFNAIANKLSVVLVMEDRQIKVPVLDESASR